jgi:hypothetical protein
MWQSPTWTELALESESDASGFLQDFYQDTSDFAPISLQNIIIALSSKVLFTNVKVDVNILFDASC